MTHFGMTPKQHELLSYIESHIAEKGYSPSFEDMKNALGVASKSGVHRLVCSLEERGLIVRIANASRSVAINHNAPDNLGAAI